MPLGGKKKKSGKDPHKNSTSGVPKKKSKFKSVKSATIKKGSAKHKKLTRRNIA